MTRVYGMSGIAMINRRRVFLELEVKFPQKLNKLVIGTLFCYSSEELQRLAESELSVHTP